MNNAALALGLSLMFSAVLMILLAIPLLKRKIPMNRWYGARFKKSFESDENWYRINAYGAKQLIIWSIPLLIIGLVAIFLPLEGNARLFNAIAFSPLLVCVPCLVSYRYARKL